MQPNDNFASESEAVAKQPSFISVDEMAKTLSIARGTAYKLIKMKGFPYFRIKKRIIIPLDLLNEWAKKQARNQTDILPD